jgi:hypothetical protein
MYKKKSSTENQSLHHDNSHSYRALLVKKFHVEHRPSHTCECMHMWAYARAYAHTQTHTKCWNINHTCLICPCMASSSHNWKFLKVISLLCTWRHPKQCNDSTERMFIKWFWTANLGMAKSVTQVLKRWLHSAKVSDNSYYGISSGICKTIHLNSTNKAIQ